MSGVQGLKFSSVWNTLFYFFAAEMASKVMEGEMMSMILRPPKGGYGQHLRVVSITPISSSFQPVIAVLPKHCTSGLYFSLSSHIDFLE